MFKIVLNIQRGDLKTEVARAGVDEQIISMFKFVYFNKRVARAQSSKLACSEIQPGGTAKPVYKAFFKLQA